MLRSFLEEIIQHSQLHAKWLNTLSYMEHYGAKLIARVEERELVDEMFLKHAAEEFRHAWHLKRQIAKLGHEEEFSTYAPSSLLGGVYTRYYLSYLNALICKELKQFQVYTPSFAYLLVTYAIEERASIVYPL